MKLVLHPDEEQVKGFPVSAIINLHYWKPYNGSQVVQLKIKTKLEIFTAACNASIAIIPLKFLVRITHSF